MADESTSDINIKAGIEYMRIKKTLELDRKVFRPCEIRHFEKGILRKYDYLVHYDGHKWDILIINDKGEPKRYILS